MDIDKNRTVNVAVQVLPFVDDIYSVVDKAIEVIGASGVTYEVTPMETVMEGPLDELLEVAKQAHLACIEAGAEQVITYIKIADNVCGGTTIEDKMGKYRPGDAPSNG